MLKYFTAALCLNVCCFFVDLDLKNFANGGWVAVWGPLTKKKKKMTLRAKSKQNKAICPVVLENKQIGPKFFKDRRL